MRASPEDILGMAFFARVVEGRSFSEAARSMGISKSAVSARVARLETRLGVRLLHRTTRRLALTADGVRLYERCARVVAEADEAADIAAGASAIPRGTLRIHAPPAFAQAYLTTPIAEFMHSHEGVRIDLRASDRVRDIAVDGIDVGIVVATRLADSMLKARKLASVRVAVCGAPSYLRRKGIPFRPQDLVLHDCLSHSARHGSDEWPFHTDEGVVSIASHARFIVDDTGILHGAVLSGLGIAMLPAFLVDADLAAGRLHRVLDDFQTIELGVYALHPHGQLAPASVRAFVDHLVECFRRPGWESSMSHPMPAPPRRAKRRLIPMTEQDVRRLGAVAALYADVDAAASAELHDALAGAKVMRASKMPRTSVTMNSRVRCRNGSGDDRELSLVYPWDKGRDRISVLSALGRDMLGASVGSEVRDGARTMTLLSIPYQPEAAGDHHL